MEIEKSPEENKKKKEEKKKEGKEDEDAPFTLGDRMKTYLAGLFSIIAIIDALFSIYNIAKASISCASGSGWDWRMILLLSNTVLLVANLGVSAAFPKHALFTYHPILFLVHCVMNYRANPKDGFKVNCMRSQRERARRLDIKEQGAVCTLTAAFFSSCRAAVMMNLVFKLGVVSFSIVINTLLVFILYFRLFFMQCFFCLAFYKLNVGIGKAFILGCFFVYAMIIGLPIITSIIIWENLTSFVAQCDVKSVEN